jgi:hypothetical protein
MAWHRNADISTIQRLGSGSKSDIEGSMTKLLEQGIEAVRALPEDRQDMAGQLLLNIARNDPRYRLTMEQIEDTKLSIAEADRGEFATDAEVSEIWKKFGL